MVQTLVHTDANSSRVRWDVRSRTGRPVATGLNIFSGETPEGAQKQGRFVIIK
ncbi:MAG: hypothetical protein ACE5IY_18850 [bacterium]